MSKNYTPIYSWVRKKNSEGEAEHTRVWLQPLLDKYLHMHTPFCIKYLFITIRIRRTAFYCVRQYFLMTLTHSSPLSPLSPSFSVVVVDFLPNIFLASHRGKTFHHVCHTFTMLPAGFKRKKSYEKCIENDWLESFSVLFYFVNCLFLILGNRQRTALEVSDIIKTK